MSDDTPIGGSWSPPPDHVKRGVEWIVDHPYALLADDMGGMKTAQAIISAQFLFTMGLIDRVIIVAPAAVRPKVWFDKDLGQLNEQLWSDIRHLVSEFHQKVKQWRHGPEGEIQLRWVVTNYEWIRIREHLDVLLKLCNQKTFLIFDESSAVRTWDSLQTLACGLLRWRATARGRPAMGFPRAGRILELNGTPVAESPLDMFSQMNLLHPSILDCKYVTYFKSRYGIAEPVLERGKPMVRHGKVVTNITSWTNLEDLQQRCAPYILRRDRTQFGIDWALPPVGLTVELSADEWKVYKEMRDEMVAWLKQGVVTARQAGVKSIRLAQITSGFIGGLEDGGFSEDSCDEPKFDDYGLPLWDSDRGEEIQGTSDHRTPSGTIVEVGRSKLDFALDWQDERLKRDPGLKLLTWCRFVPELKRYLSEVSIKFPGMVLGAASGSKIIQDELNKRIERENALRLLHPKTAPKGAVTVGATQGTGAMGLNFTACRTVLDMSYDFSPWKKSQGDSRVNRTGQTGPVSFFYLVAVGPKGQKTMDHHVMMQRLGKAKVNDWTVAAWVERLMEE